MGCCISSKRRNIAIPDIKLLSLRPSIFIEENFKLMDFTHRTKNVEIFSELRGYFENYKLTDIRCVRRLDEGDEIHSTLIAMSHSIIEENNVEELWYCIYSLVIQYSPYGFALFVGEADNILTSCNIKENSMEMMHLPGADSNCNGGLFEIIE